MTVTENLSSALEHTSDKVASHLHPEGSFDLEHFEVPSGREEIWRFTPLRRLKGLHDGSFTPLGDATPASVTVTAPDGVTVELVGRDDVRLGSVYTPTDRISAQAWNGFTQARVITVAPEADLDEVIAIDVTGNSDRAEFHHLHVAVGDHARATVVLHHRGSAVRAANVEISVGAGAALNLVSIQDWDDDAVHVAHFHAHVGRDADYKQGVVSIGGDLVRINASVDYAGPGANAELLGLYFADAGQHLEHRLFVDHNAPRTKSNVDYRGALQGRGARSVWIGDVLIRKVAEGIQTYEQNRNLILTDGCHADSVPNLEIETGEIEGAGHASTTGRFDDQQLFYLESRGIPAEEARRLVVHGFFNEIIRKIGVDVVEEHLLATVKAELAKNVGALR